MSTRDCDECGREAGFHKPSCVTKGATTVKRHIKIAFEGGDAVGKATQSKMLAERYGARLFSFPNYNTETGRAILGHLKEEWVCAVEGASDVEGEPAPQWQRAGAQLDMMAFQSLMASNRYEAADEIIREAQARHVVFDRYSLSGIVYGTVEGLDPDWLWRLHSSLPQPDAWILLDAPVDTGFARRPERRDRNERNRGKLYKLRNEYLRVFDERRFTHPTQFWEIIDATRSREAVHADICARLRGHFGRDVIDDLDVGGGNVWVESKIYPGSCSRCGQPKDKHHDFTGKRYCFASEVPGAAS
jgi:thymidylate kinase